MTGFDVTHEALREATDAVRRAADLLRDDRRSIDQAARSVLGQGWSGESASTFVDGWEEWERGLRDVEDGLGAMSELLAQTNRSYGDSDARSRGDLDAVAQRIVDRLG